MRYLDVARSLLEASGSASSSEMQEALARAAVGRAYDAAFNFAKECASSAGWKHDPHKKRRRGSHEQVWDFFDDLLPVVQSRGEDLKRRRVEADYFKDVDGRWPDNAALAIDDAESIVAELRAAARREADQPADGDGD